MHKVENRELVERADNVMADDYTVNYGQCYMWCFKIPFLMIKLQSQI